MTKTYFLQRFSRLEPCQPWRGGRITDTDLLTLEEAAREACRHSGQDVSVNDFLRAAARGEILLRAIVHTSAKVEKFDGGIFCNQGDATENTVPKGAIPTLPLVACQQLANVGSARWRTFDGFEIVDGDMCRFTVATLADGEPDFETVTADCRVIGFDVHALADAFAGGQSDTSPNHPDSAEAEPANRLGQLPAYLQSAADRVTQQCKGVSKREILAADWPLVSPYSMARLERNLGDVSNLQWLQPARVGQPGAAGKGSHRWNPALLASCLCSKGYIINKTLLLRMFETHFPEYLDQWQEITEWQGNSVTQFRD